MDPLPFRIPGIAMLAAALVASGMPADALAQRESGRPEVTTFRAADAGAALGTGPIVVAAADGAEAVWKLPVYEAAVVDELARHGYDTATSPASGGQVAQIMLSRDVVQPEEPPRRPVSGEMGVMVGNRGSATHMGLAIDLTKPKKALVSTRMEVRIRDRMTDRVLWEGRAEVASRAGDSGPDDSAIAARLAQALFARFPEGTVVGHDG